MKKVLFIACFFPPVGGIGAIRSLKFVKYLGGFGWEPVVVSVGNTRYSIKDESLLEGIPKSINVIRIDDLRLKNFTDEFLGEMKKRISYPLGLVNDNTLLAEFGSDLESKITPFRDSFFLPDLYGHWANVVVDKIPSLVNMNDIQMIFSTSAPYSNHIVGYYLKQKYHIPWVAEFRDEWTNSQYTNYDYNSLRYKLERSMEEAIVLEADKIITTTHVSTLNYIKNFSLPVEKVKTITNGYDEADFQNIISKRTQNEKFTIVHNGLFYGMKNPSSFLQAVQNLSNKGRINPEKILIRFTGIEKKWLEGISTYGFGNIEWTNYLNHLESIQVCNNADLLLVIIGEGEKCKQVQAGKIFEYLRTGQPILALAPRGSVTDDLLTETKRGKTIEFSDIEGIEACIYERYLEWLSGKSPVFIDYNAISKYERRFLTEQLADILITLL